MLKRALGFALVAALCFAGCTEEKPEPKEVEQAPPEPTADQIHQELYAAVQAFWRPFNNGAPLSAAENESLINQLKGARTKNQQYKGIGEAEQKLRNQLQQLIRDAQETGRWRVVKGGITAYNVITPDSSRYDRLNEKTDKILARPIVKCTGFAKVDGETFILFRITDALTKAVTTEQARVGERICGGSVEVVEIIGNNQEVRLNYVPIDDDDWVTPGPKKHN